MLRYKVLLLGDSSVGKTSFILRFTESKFDEDSLTTIGIDTKKKFLKRNGKKIQLDIWDTAGQERFRSITKNCYKGADGIILMFDLSKKKTYQNIKEWIVSIKNAIDINTIGFVVVANKCDLEESLVEVDEEMKQKLIDDHKITLVTASAKSDINVTESFTALIDNMLKLNVGKKLKGKKKIDDDDDEDEEDNGKGKKLKSGKNAQKTGKKKCCGK